MSAKRVGHLARHIDYWPGNTDHRAVVRFESSQDMRHKSLFEKLIYMTEEASCRGSWQDDRNYHELSKPSLHGPDKGSDRSPMTKASALAQNIELFEFEKTATSRNTAQILDESSHQFTTDPIQGQDLPIELTVEVENRRILHWKSF